MFILDQYEIWKQIKDFPDYDVSNLGRVRSRRRSRITFLSFYETEAGYLVVYLLPKKVEGQLSKRKKVKVHRLVCEYFCKDFSDEKEVHHKNFIRFDNRADNLIALSKQEHRKLHTQIRKEIQNNADSSQLENNKDKQSRM